jgi:hypothetical protein
MAARRAGVAALICRRPQRPGRPAGINESRDDRDDRDAVRASAAPRHERAALRRTGRCPQRTHRSRQGSHRRWRAVRRLARPPRRTRTTSCSSRCRSDWPTWWSLSAAWRPASHDLRRAAQLPRSDGPACQPAARGGRSTPEVGTDSQPHRRRRPNRARRAARPGRRLAPFRHTRARRAVAAAENVA